MKNIDVRYQSENDQVISYLNLRKLIGIIGIFLPIILPIILVIFNNDSFIQDSISDYYGTEARDYFVGFMFALGLFLMTYKGYKSGNDNLFANLGAVFALGVALFPATSEQDIIRTIHIVSAVLLFAVFTYFCLVIFKRTTPNEEPTEMKKTRNKFYTICGITIILFIVLAGLSLQFLSKETRAETNIIFWCELVALWAFGFSWLVKGETFLTDKKD